MPGHSTSIISRRRLLWTVAAACASAAGARSGHAQSYPTRPVRLVLPYTAGSPNDVLARLLAPHLTAPLGQTVVVDNRPGGGTTIGVSAVMAAEGDGHTLLFSNSPSHQIAPLVNHNLTYDPLRDFVPIAIAGVSSNVIVIGNDVPATNVQELVAHAKANPGKLNFGFGQGTLPQLVGEMFKTAAGIDIANVPYKGGAQAVTDLLGGRIQLNIGTAATLLPLHRAGKLRMIAYTGTARRPDMADIPTMRESGYPAVTSATYYGILGRAGLPADVVDRLNREVNEILQSADFRDSIARVGFEAKAFSPAELTALFADEARKWATIVRATGFQL
jgi:tripartite-type tricarboxylate transporter receptor subunit TctC